MLTRMGSLAINQVCVCVSWSLRQVWEGLQVTWVGEVELSGIRRFALQDLNIKYYVLRATCVVVESNGAINTLHFRLCSAHFPCRLHYPFSSLNPHGHPFRTRRLFELRKVLALEACPNLCMANCVKFLYHGLSRRDRNIGWIAF